MQICFVPSRHASVFTVFASNLWSIVTRPTNTWAHYHIYIYMWCDHVFGGLVNDCVVTNGTIKSWDRCTQFITLHSHQVINCTDSRHFVLALKIRRHCHRTLNLPYAQYYQIKMWYLIASPVCLELKSDKSHCEAFIIKLLYFTS